MKNESEDRKKRDAEKREVGFRNSQLVKVMYKCRIMSRKRYNFLIFFNFNQEILFLFNVHI